MHFPLPFYSDLKWNRITERLVKNANKRMRLLHVAAKFVNNDQDMVYLYKMFIRSVLEFSAVVWHSSMSQNNVSDIERIQKSALKVILKERYTDYKSALKELNFESLSKRREILCLRFAKKSLKLQNFKNLFPLNNINKHCMRMRKKKKFLEKHANTDRYKKSSILYMQRLLNQEDNIFKTFLSHRNVKSYAIASELRLSDSITIDNLNYNK